MDLSIGVKYHYLSVQILLNFFRVELSSIVKTKYESHWAIVIYNLRNHHFNNRKYRALPIDGVFKGSHIGEVILIIH